MSKLSRSNAPIYVTMGDPSGVGPEVAVAAYNALSGKIGAHPLKLAGDADVFRAQGSIPDEALIATTRVKFHTPGRTDSANAPAILAAIEESVRAAQSGEVAAVVTAPIHKASLFKAGFAFPGHTEFLAHLTGAPRAVMMLVGADLRVVPLTIHIPYIAVPGRITKAAIVETGRIVLDALRTDFGRQHPRLAVAGLNPHAGEDGAIGREEETIIAPAVEALRTRGDTILGPLPPDTMFHEEARARYDAALCMYHDQALIPLKTLAFWDGVNVTLGLPIVRTSPDHGTALDIAGQKKADPRSMIAAIRLAAEIADARYG
ncbi:MAG TPA: 4-hydroxythreonine-4-phosphate dehydrogenase PdxA [Rhizomicrobium sp.]|nr:4-hydroxythreonine-4-phosphate dehydrogenase PdxA [Rhizomicrobium sp.]